MIRIFGSLVCMSNLRVLSDVTDVLSAAPVVSIWEYWVDVAGTAGGRDPQPGSTAGVLDPPAHLECEIVGSNRDRRESAAGAGGTPAVPVGSCLAVSAE